MSNGTKMRPNTIKWLLSVIFVFLVFFAIGSLFPLAADNSTTADQESEEINLFESGAFDSPDSCRGCHPEIYAQWSGSKHRFAWEDDFYQPDYLQASHETGGFTDVFCGECHAPVAVRTRQLPPPDASLFDDRSKKGVSCDYCHTVSDVVEPVNVRTISDPGRVKRGPKGDGRSPVHEVKFSKIHTDSAFCGACHNVVHPTSGVIIIDTYNDWKQGPYAQEGIRCQDCHMTPGPGVEKNPGKQSVMSKERDHVATHFFAGGSVLFQERVGNDAEAAIARRMLEAAAELEAIAEKTEKGIDLIVRVKNTGAGHKIPTGVTYIRKMWLEITVIEASGSVIYSSGHVMEGNHIDPGTVFYQKVFRDSEGNLTPKSWLAEEIAYDNRISPKHYDEQIFEIPTTAGNHDDLHLTVRLMYRSMSQEVAEKSGIDGLEIPGIEMARTELHIK